MSKEPESVGVNASDNTGGTSASKLPALQIQTEQQSKDDRRPVGRDASSVSMASVASTSSAASKSHILSTFEKAKAAAEAKKRQGQAAGHQSVPLPQPQVAAVAPAAASPMKPVKTTAKPIVQPTQSGSGSVSGSGSGSGSGTGSISSSRPTRTNTNTTSSPKKAGRWRIRELDVPDCRLWHSWKQPGPLDVDVDVDNNDEDEFAEESVSTAGKFSRTSRPVTPTALPPHVLGSPPDMSPGDEDDTEEDMYIETGLLPPDEDPETPEPPEVTAGSPEKPKFIPVPTDSDDEQYWGAALASNTMSTSTGAHVVAPRVGTASYRTSSDIGESRKSSNKPKFKPAPLAATLTSVLKPPRPKIDPNEDDELVATEIDEPPSPVKISQSGPAPASRPTHAAASPIATSRPGSRPPSGRLGRGRVLGRGNTTAGTSTSDRSPSSSSSPASTIRAPCISPDKRKRPGTVRGGGAARLDGAVPMDRVESVDSTTSGASSTKRYRTHIHSIAGASSSAVHILPTPPVSRKNSAYYGYPRVETSDDDDDGAMQTAEELEMDADVDMPGAFERGRTRSPSPLAGKDTDRRRSRSKGKGKIGTGMGMGQASTGTSSVQASGRLTSPQPNLRRPRRMSSVRFESVSTYRYANHVSDYVYSQCSLAPRTPQTSAQLPYHCFHHRRWVA
jgi:hypothetical protein